MKLFKKIITLLFGLQLTGCATPIDEPKPYICESKFKSKYSEVKGYITNGMYEKALTLLTKLDEQAYPPAIYTLYELYSEGLGVKLDEKKALIFLKRADASKYPLAEYELNMKNLEEETSQTKREAILAQLKELGKRLNKAESGENNIFYKLNSKVFITLGKIYFEGKYVIQDLDEAFKYSKIVGTFPPTQEANVGRELLGDAYLLFGRVLEAREDKKLNNDNLNSFVWYKNAIEMENLEGYYYNGLLYLKEKDIKNAVSSFGTGCYQGHAGSCYMAGKLYEEEKVYKNGDKDEQGNIRRNPMDYVLDYYKKGSKLGSQKCQERLESIKSKK